MRSCRKCQTAFTINPKSSIKTYCRLCVNAANRASRLRRMVEVTCKDCQTHFQTDKRRLNVWQGRCRPCQHIVNGQNRRLPSLREKVCPKCNQVFLLHKRASWCAPCTAAYQTARNRANPEAARASVRARYHRDKVEVACIDCGTVRKVNKTYLQRGKSRRCVPCSAKEIVTRPEVLAKRRRENHPRWKGGTKPLQLVVRGSTEYKLWRKQIIERDNKTCQICQQLTEKPEVDHYPKPFIKIYEAFEQTNLHAREYEDFWDINNGRTLCSPCHKRHGWNYSNHRKRT